MEDIRGAAKVSVGSLYHHFPSKEAIAAALYVSLIGEYQASVQRVVAAAKSPKARIRSAIRHHIEWSTADPVRTRFLLSHREPDVQKLSDPEIASLNRSLERSVQEWLDHEAGRGSIRKMSADIYVSLVIGSAQSFVRRWITGSTTTPPQRAIDALSEAAWRAIRVEPHSPLKPTAHRKVTAR
jgi:AcrR family transcriptional regulator